MSISVTGVKNELIQPTCVCSSGICQTGFAICIWLYYYYWLPEGLKPRRPLAAFLPHPLCIKLVLKSSLSLYEGSPSHVLLSWALGFDWLS